MTANGYGVCFRGDEKVLNLTVVMAAQFYNSNILKMIERYTWNG